MGKIMHATVFFYISPALMKKPEAPLVSIVTRGKKVKRSRSDDVAERNKQLLAEMNKPDIKNVREKNSLCFPHDKMICDNDQYFEYAFVDMILTKTEIDRNRYDHLLMQKEKIIGQTKQMLIDNGYVYCARYSKIKDLLDQCLGMSVKEFILYVRQKSRDDQWIAAEDPLLGIVRSNEYEEGFSVYVLMNSTMNFVERREYFKDHKQDIMSFAAKEVPNEKRISALIGNIEMYEPVSISMLEGKEIEVFFELKKNYKRSA